MTPLLLGWVTAVALVDGWQADPYRLSNGMDVCQGERAVHPHAIAR